MRELTDASRLRQFMRVLGSKARASGRIYLTGGATAVLFDWRPTTVDVDLELDAQLQSLLREIPAIKEDLRINVELAARGLIDPSRLLAFFEQIAPELHRYPALDPASFRRAVEQTVDDLLRH